MRLVLSIAAAWYGFDFAVGHMIVRVFGPIDLGAWHQIASAFHH